MKGSGVSTSSVKGVKIDVVFCDELKIKAGMITEINLQTFPER